MMILLSEKRKTILKRIAFILILTLLFAGTTLEANSVYSYATDRSVDVSVRIEDADTTVLPYTELSVGKFNIEPFLTGDKGSFQEPAEIVSAHALIEAIYYKIYEEDPEASTLSSPDLTDQTVSAIKKELAISYGQYGLGINSIDGNTNLVVSMINDESGYGIGSDVLLSGDSLVFYPYTCYYSYFDKDEVSFDAPSHSLGVKLFKKGYDALFNYVFEPVSGAAIQAYSSGVTVSGITNLSGKAELELLTDGEYILYADLDGIVKPYAKANISEGGCTVVYPAQDLVITELHLSGVDVLSNVILRNLYTLPYAANAVSLSAITVPAGTTFSAKYTDVSGASTDISIGQDINLSEGMSSILFSLSNSKGQKKDYKLAIKRLSAAENKYEVIEAALNAISSREDMADNSDWVATQLAYDKSLTPIQRETFLTKVLFDSRKDTIDANAISKDIIALANMGIDPRNVPDAYGNPVDLVKMIYNYKVDLGDYGIYTAPYMLLALASNDYVIPYDANWTKDKLIAYILDQQDEETGAWGGMYASAGDTASILLAIAPYISDDVVNSAALKAIDFISGNQADNGTFDGANYTSFVVLAASMLGLDADSDPALVTEFSASAYDGLMSFKITSGPNENMFSLKDGSTFNNMATIDSYRALLSYKYLLDGENTNIFNLGKTLVVFDDWPDSDNPLTGIRVASPPDKRTYIAGEIIDLSGIVVEAVYADGTSEVLDPGNGTSGYKLDLEWYESIDAPLTTGVYTKTVSYQGKVASFIIEVKSDIDKPSELKGATISIKDNTNNYILRPTRVEINPGKTTVMDALKTALDRAEISYAIQGGAYISNIDGLGEFDSGENSGWLYSVNGETPSTTGAYEYTLEGNESIVWYFTQDFTKDPSSSKWVNANVPAGSVATIEAKVDAAGNVKATVTEKEFQDAVAAKSGLEIISQVASISFDADALSAIGDQVKGDLSITMNKADTSKLSDADKLLIGSRPVYEFTVKSGSKIISQFDRKVTVSLAYKPAEGEDPNAIVIYHISDDGKLELVKDCVYNEKTGSIQFRTDHFSAYAVGYNWVAFDDTKTHWAKNPISYLASRDIIKGMTVSSFAPEKRITRAEFVTILANKAGVDLTKPQSSDTSFVDVKTGDWYANAVAWAADQGVAAGIKAGDGSLLFQPNAKISRQDMAVMLSRYLDKVEKTTLKTLNPAINFSDRAFIADYAGQAVKTMQQAGIINGKAEATFAPRDNATRAEACQMITQLMKNTL